MKPNDKYHWLKPSPPLAVDDGERTHAAATETLGTPRAQREPRAASVSHAIRLADLRKRFGDDDQFAALCSCGWSGETRTGLMAERAARRDGVVHLDGQRPPYRNGGPR